MKIIMTEIMYWIQIFVYLVGIKAFFHKNVKRKWFPIITGNIFILLGTRAVRTEQQFEMVFLLIYILAIIISIILLEGKAGERIIIVLSLFCISACTDEVFSIVLRRLIYLSDTYDDIYNILEGFLTMGLFAVICKISERLSIKQEKMLGIVRQAIVLVVISMSFCQIVTVCGLLFAKNYIINQQLKAAFDIVCILSFIGMIGIILFIIYIRATNEQMEQLLIAERDLKRMQEQYYNVLLEKESETKKYRHDMNNHLLCIYELAEMKDIEGLRNYVGQLEDKFFLMQKKCYMTGNDILDILLNYYFADLKDISLSVIGQCTKELTMSSVECCTVFSNVIQNAVEEVKRLQEKEKFIKVKIMQRTNCIIIFVKNSSGLVIMNDDKKFETVKKDKEKHGIGIKNVTEVVKKHGGSFSLKSDGKEAVAELILPCK